MFSWMCSVFLPNLWLDFWWTIACFGPTSLQQKPVWLFHAIPDSLLAFLLSCVKLRVLVAAETWKLASCRITDIYRIIGIESKWHGTTPDRVALLFIMLHQSNHFSHLLSSVTRKGADSFQGSLLIKDHMVSWPVSPCYLDLTYLSCFINQ